MFKKIVFLLILASLCLFFQSNQIFSSQDISEIKILKDNLVKEIFIHEQKSILYENNGAIGENVLYDQGKKSFWSIFEQRKLYIFIIRGIVENNSELIDQGIRSLSYGLEHQLRDGSFPDSSWYETEQFISFSCRSLLLLNKSKYYNRYKDEIEKKSSQLMNSIYWLKENFDEKNLYSDKNYSSNLLADTALYFYLGGIFINDLSYKEKAKEIIIILLKSQRNDGVFPDKDGYDSYYQVRTLNGLMIYLLSSDDHILNVNIFKALERGWEWQISRIKQDGSISVLGNSRTGMRYKGNIFSFNKIDYFEIAISMIYWAYISNNEGLLPISRKVFNYGVSVL